MRDFEIVRRRAASSLRAKPANSPPAPLGLPRDGALGASPLSVDLVFRASEASVGQESGRKRSGAPSGVLTQVPRGRGRSPRVDRLNERSFESAEGDRES